MNHIAKNILKTLLLSATVAIANHAKAANSDSLPSLNLNDEDKDVKLGDNKKSIMKGVLKIKRNGEAKLIAGHTSHRSHSSHRSSRGGHYSHSSSAHYSHSSSSSSYGSSSSSGSTYTKTTKTPDEYALGERTLSNGLYGRDVDVLIPYLVKNLYLEEKKLVKKGGFYLYDASVEEAVKHFQKDADVTVDGKLTGSQVQKLMDWNLSKVTIPLGARTLTIGISGFDVDELIQKLEKAGYAPNPEKIEKENNHYVLTEDVVMAVKVFQAYNGIQPTGNLDQPTISKLNTI